jgi:hypothetical protein
MMPGGSYAPINPAGLTVGSHLDHVTLTVGDVAVNLSDLMKSLGRLVEAVENGLKEAFKSFPARAASDMCIALAFEVASDDTAVMRAEEEIVQTTQDKDSKAE